MDIATLAAKEYRRAMLRGLRLDAWKSFASERGGQGLDFGPLTLLVGPNASGKSNVLDAIRFLQGAALDFPLGDVLRGRWEGQREIWGGVRGQLAEAARFGSDAFAIESDWVFGEKGLTHAMGVELRNDAFLAHERLADADGYWFDTHAEILRANSAGWPSGPGIAVAFRTAHESKPETAQFPSTHSLLGPVERVATAHPELAKHAHVLRTALREVVFLDIQPSRMRDYRPLAGRHLGLSGENISPVLASLEKDRLDDIVDWLSELCAPGVEGIHFDKTQLREVMLFLVEQGEHRISARSMSDGTLRFLGLVTALLTSPPGTLMLLEEPDVGLHPARIHLLARLLEHATTKGEIQVIATTHSPTLLAHLSPDAFGDVIAMARDPETGATIASRVEDLPDAEVLRTSDHLERLISTGWLERAL